jgi:hypothetical protein
MLEGRGSRSEVAAEAPADEDQALLVHLRYAYGEVDHGDFRRDSDLFGEGVRNPGAQSRIRAAMKRCFQTREADMVLARMLGDLADR